MKITIQANSGEFSFDCEANERMLYAGLSQGLRLPYECATGTCGTCRGRVVQGSTLVEWEEAPGFARLKRAKGDVLMCQARPTADCVVRVPANLVADPASPTLPLHRRGRIERCAGSSATSSRSTLRCRGRSRSMRASSSCWRCRRSQGGRAYSMVNYRRDSDRLTFVIKQKPGGGFSDWLFGGDVTGAELDLFGPLGGATFRPAEGRDILCIAGGSGIAGMLSILEHASSESYFRDHAGHVFFGVRGLADGFYLQELSDYVAAAAGKLDVTLALSHEPAPGATHPQFPHIRLASGMVTDVMTRRWAAATTAPSASSPARRRWWTRPCASSSGSPASPPPSCATTSIREPVSLPGSRKGRRMAACRRDGLNGAGQSVSSMRCDART